MKKLLILACLSMLPIASFTSQQANAAVNNHGMKSSEVTDFSARKKMKRMRRGSMDKSKMGGEPAATAAGGSMK